jgi:uncharacterized RDD family membrane protein YckC
MIGPAPNLRKRMACLVYDLLLLCAIEFMLFLLPNMTLAAFIGLVLPGSALLVHLLLVAGLYFVWFWHREGQTLAMRTWRIRLENADGTRAPLHRLWLRFMWALLTNLPIGLGFFWSVFDRDRQFLHDRLAGTRLVAA